MLNLFNVQLLIFTDGSACTTSVSMRGGLRYGDEIYQFEYEGPPESATDIISAVADVKIQVAEQIRIYLSLKRPKKYRYMFESDAYLARQRTLDYDSFEDWWDRMTESLKFEKRYFNGSVQSLLREIFDGLERRPASEWQDAVLMAGPDEPIKSFFRARVFQSEVEIRRTILYPDIELGPPPPKSARAGRLNPEGVGIFYGALGTKARETAIAETRPPVGSTVLSAEFLLLRDVRLLSIPRLAGISDFTDQCDPAYERKRQLHEFLHTLSGRVSRPVLPSDESMEYLVTQVIMDWLEIQDDLSLDGIIYHSAQTDNTAENVALFRRSSRVEAMESNPAKNLKVRRHHEHWAPFAYEVVYDSLSTTPDPASTHNERFNENLWRPRLITLKYVPESINVHEIRNAKIDFRSTPVGRPGLRTLPVDDDDSF
ncbi:MAG: RES family NAD+ phosphorylase [bacterium]